MAKLSARGRTEISRGTAPSGFGYVLVRQETAKGSILQILKKDKFSGGFSVLPLTFKKGVSEAVVIRFYDSLLASG